MICPKCGKGKLLVENSYSTPSGVVQRRVCPSCETVFTTTTITTIVNENPPTGEGAYAVAKKMREEISSCEQDQTQQASLQ